MHLCPYTAGSHARESRQYGAHDYFLIFLPSSTLHPTDTNYSTLYVDCTMSGYSTTNGPRVKRQAEASGRYQDTGSSSKKPRFDYRNPSTLAPDVPEEDAILELDEIGKGGQQTKRNAVNLDGYDTDSSDENFDARADEKARLVKSTNDATGSKDEEEMDMFADLDQGTAGTGTGQGDGDGDGDEELSQEGKQGKKSVRFMDIDDIEGQVHSSKSGGHVSADFALGSDKANGKRPRALDEECESSSESGSDTERDQIIPGDDDAAELGAGSKKKHAPKLDAFNMQQEGEEGRFDEFGNFIRKAADPDAVHDSWLDGLSKKDMKKARDAQEKRDEERRRKTAADDALIGSDLLSTLIVHLDKGETALEALQRLQAQAKSKPKAKKVPKWKQKKEAKDSDAMDLDTTDAATHTNTEDEDPAEAKRKAAVDAITGAADALFSRNQPDIYDQEREVLMRQYRRETGEDWQPPPDLSGDTDGGAGFAGRNNQEVADHQMWEYRWADGRDGGEKHGPYDGKTMRAWNEAGYFGEGVEFSRIGLEGEWTRSVEF